MGFDRYQVLTETAAPQFVRAGGTIEYHEKINDNGDSEFWVIGVKPNGDRINFVIARTGALKVYKNVDGLWAFHRRVHPQMTAFVINVPEHESAVQNVAAAAALAPAI